MPCRHRDQKFLPVIKRLPPYRQIRHIGLGYLLSPLADDIVSPQKIAINCCWYLGKYLDVRILFAQVQENLQETDRGFVTSLSASIEAEVAGACNRAALDRGRAI